MKLTRDEVQALNIPAINKSKFYLDEHGMDWELWRHFPGHGFSDGHDYGELNGYCEPLDGWEPEVTEVKFPVETLVTLMRGLKAQQLEVTIGPGFHKRADRVAAANKVQGELAALTRLLYKPVG